MASRASCTVATLVKMYKLFTFVRIGAETTLLHHYLYQAARGTHRSLVLGARHVVMVFLTLKIVDTGYKASHKNKYDSILYLLKWCARCVHVCIVQMLK